MIEKANRFAVLFGLPATCDASYIKRWRERNNVIWQGKEHGGAASVDMAVVSDWVGKQATLCAPYRDEDIFNTDETGLYYQLEPNGTMKFKREKCAGGKQSKIRCTVLVTASMTGEKLPLLIIGKSLNPRCLKNINRNNLGAIYRNNASFWMTTILFNEWLKKVDSKFRDQNRRVLLLADNFSGYAITFKPTNTVVQFYPPNCTAKIQAMDQGIIANFKHFYRTGVVKSIVDIMEHGLAPLVIDIKGAIDRSVVAWNQVKQSTITNCFIKAGHKLKVAQPVIIEPEVELTIDPEFWRRVDPTNSISFQEYVNVNSELATSRTVDDESIVNNIIMQQQDETESDEEEIISPTSLQVIPSRRQAEEYIAGLRLYLPFCRN